MRIAINDNGDDTAQYGGLQAEYATSSKKRQRHERNRGLAAARNTALDAAQGSFLTHVDSDDYLDRDAIRLLVNKQVETGADISIS